MCPSPNLARTTSPSISFFQSFSSPFPSTLEAAENSCTESKPWDSDVGLGSQLCFAKQESDFAMSCSVCDLQVTLEYEMAEELPSCCIFHELPIHDLKCRMWGGSCCSGLQVVCSGMHEASAWFNLQESVTTAEKECSTTSVHGALAQLRELKAAFCCSMAYAASRSSCATDFAIMPNLTQVAMAPEDKAKTAFTTGRGLWQFVTKPFGLCNAPATFERLMEKVLVDMPPERCLVYLDDLLVHWPCFDSAFESLAEIMVITIREFSKKFKEKFVIIPVGDAYMLAKTTGMLCSTPVTMTDQPLVSEIVVGATAEGLKSRMRLRSRRLPTPGLAGKQQGGLSP
ncbi:hypothetical protein F2P81_004996 [Scophthalmus maximus]|uniref:ribonuclease H n=1 Tax=Scophthalmus maximus TaxID=52904 RepID=A0A6A4TFQ9_SCOMX|nr:hypothetical protein F2P81_004996 [Scophthalmus maximus]